MLRVADLDVFYGPFQALRGVSFEIDKQETAVILGANNAGKTTTLKTITGVLKPRKGSIEFDGIRIETLTPNKICEKGIACVPEGRRLFPYMSVLENLELGAFTKSVWSKKSDSLDHVYTLFPILKQRTKQLAYTLSGGEQQMVAFGRALMSCPKLLMLDEPSLGLAPKIVLQIFETIRELQKSGLSILLVEQNIHEALSIANEAYVMEHGVIVRRGIASELKADDGIRKAYLGL